MPKSDRSSCTMQNTAIWLYKKVFSKHLLTFYSMIIRDLSGLSQTRTRIGVGYRKISLRVILGILSFTRHLRLNQDGAVSIKLLGNASS